MLSFGKVKEDKWAELEDKWADPQHNKRVRVEMNEMIVIIYN